MKVFIVGGGAQYVAMFERQEGYEVVSDVEEADILQFTGGEDVTPSYYGHNHHPRTYNNENRDAKEEALFKHYLGKKPMLGICRGAQFLNVMNGGALYQHVDNHALGGTHKLFSGMLQQEVDVTSTHHQMIITGNLAIVEGYVPNSLCDTKQYVDDERGVRDAEDMNSMDIEVVFYDQTDCLCFQPHPEFAGAHSTREYYFKLIETYLG